MQGQQRPLLNGWTCSSSYLPNENLTSTCLSRLSRWVASMGTVTVASSLVSGSFMSTNLHQECSRAQLSVISPGSHIIMSSANTPYCCLCGRCKRNTPIWGRHNLLRWGAVNDEDAVVY